MDFEIKKQLEAARKTLEDLRESLDFAGREAQIAELEEIVAQPGFWDKPDEAQQIMQKITGLRSKMEQFNTVQTLVEDAETLYEMFKEMGDDEDLLKETGEAIREIIKEFTFVIGVFLLALTYNLFFLPNNLVIGGTTGISIILKKATAPY